jgi:hypothetical protein
MFCGPVVNRTVLALSVAPLLILTGKTVHAQSSPANREAVPRASYAALSAATNKLMSIGLKANPSTDEVREALEAACKALGLVATDPSLMTDLERLSKSRLLITFELKTRKENLGLFLDTFAHEERDALTKAGLDSQAADRLLSAAVSFRQSLDKPFVAKTMLSAIKELQSQICAAAKSAASAKEAAETRAALRVWAYRLGGVAIIGADAAAALSGSIVATMSAAIGVELIHFEEKPKQ